MVQKVYIRRGSQRLHSEDTPLETNYKDKYNRSTELTRHRRQNISGGTMRSRINQKGDYTRAKPLAGEGKRNLLRHPVKER